MNFIIPDWPAPTRVRAIQTTRQGGLSKPPCDSLNFGLHVGDDPHTVAKNRNLLNTICPSEPVWLEQVHGTTVVLAETAGCVPQADACITRTTNTVCAVMTADCLPVFLCDDAGAVAGIAHAGWRGLASGVIEKTVSAMNVTPSSLMAWLGPAIGVQAFEVGAEVREIFLQHSANAESAFAARGEKYLADIYLLTRQRLQALGITRIYGGDFCTFTDAERFFSYRRDGRTGRMASLIWLTGTV
ncbi:MAG: peptidoglycan editing factor PgeF [Methylobacillus sp.]|jgi:YfiH family protein|nr:peptidoglycan editing factor PgeF [Methylobacillus sp.]